MVSVIMSTYKEPIDYIKTSINSILSQTYKNIEFIVIIDDPSNTELIELLKSYKASDDRLNFYLNKENIGLTGSLNVALTRSKGNYIARMDADDISMPQRIEKQLIFLNDNSLDLVGSNIEDIDEEGNIRGGVTIFPEKHDQIVKKARYNSPLAHPTWMGKKEVFEKLDGYQEVDACEDYDFLVRAILQGFKLGNVQETLLQYRINSAGISSTKKAIQKTSLYIIRYNYMCGHKTTEEEYERFRKSEIGKKKLRDLDSYYHKTAKLKSIKDNTLKKCLYGIYIIVSSREAKLFVLNLIREKLFA